MTTYFTGYVFTSTNVEHFFQSGILPDTATPTPPPEGVLSDLTKVQNQSGDDWILTASVAEALRRLGLAVDELAALEQAYEGFKESMCRLAGDYTADNQESDCNDKMKHVEATLVDFIHLLDDLTPLDRDGRADTGSERYGHLNVLKAQAFEYAKASALLTETAERERAEGLERTGDPLTDRVATELFERTADPSGTSLTEPPTIALDPDRPNDPLFTDPVVEPPSSFEDPFTADPHPSEGPLGE